MHIQYKQDGIIQEIYIYTSPFNDNLSYILNVNEANLDLFVFFKLHNNDLLNLKTSTCHLAQDTLANTYVCGVAFDDAFFRHEGMIKIPPQGQFTKAYLKSSILLIGNNAKAESIPSLEIEANEVKASHGSTIGKLDNEQLFYLQSRGLSRKETEEMLISAFYEQYIQKINSLTIQEKVRQALNH